MRILVTGGAGFVGSNFVRRTLQDAYPGLEDAEVVMLDALTYSGNLENLAPVADSRTTASCRVISATARCSTSCSPVSTRSCTLPRARGRRTARAELAILGVQGGQRSASTQLSPHAWPDRIHHALLQELRAVLLPREGHPALRHEPRRRQASAAVRRGPNIRDWLHVDDHTRALAIVLVSGRPGEIYNIGGGTQLTNKELTQLLLDATGKDWSYVDRVPDCLGHDLRYSVHIGKIQRDLAYEPQVPFAQGLADVVQWYRDNRAWWEPLKARAAL
ncbi:putative dTDP-glucose-4,6-dehydratase [Mycena latifolia]|nr:putative dTDP-glucose-4,6-dehydratase [Mycena latifolia]